VSDLRTKGYLRIFKIIDNRFFFIRMESTK